MSGSVCSAYTSWRRRMTSSVSSATALDLGALEQALHDLVGVDGQHDHGVEAVAGERDHPVELLDLGERARVAVEQEARRGVVLVDPVADHQVGDLVGHVLPGVHEALGLEPSGGALGDVGAEDVAGRDRGDAEVLGDELRLGALAGPGRAHEDQHLILARRGVVSGGILRSCAAGAGSRSASRCPARRRP